MAVVELLASLHEIIKQLTFCHLFFRHFRHHQKCFNSPLNKADLPEKLTSACIERTDENEIHASIDTLSIECTI